MKKGRIITAVFLAATLLVGAGYAAWTDKLTVKNTVSTGELRVEFVEQNCLLSKYPSIVLTDGTRTCYATADINQTTPKITTVEVGNMYPGVLVRYDAKFENKGTIPAVIKDGDINIKFDQKSETLNNNLIVYGGFIHYKKTNSNIIPYAFKNAGIFAGTLGELKTNLNNMLKDTRMEPGDVITFDVKDDLKPQLINMLKEKYNADETVINSIMENNCINFWLPLCVNNENNVEKQTTKFDIELNFRQHNQ